MPACRVAKFDKNFVRQIGDHRVVFGGAPAFGIATRMIRQGMPSDLIRACALA
jgi:hypothetical protein